MRGIEEGERGDERGYLHGRARGPMGVKFIQERRTMILGESESLKRSLNLGKKALQQMGA